MARVAINGFGRIGRATFKILIDHPEFEVVAVNDIAPLDNLMYLLRFDTVYGRYEKEVTVEDEFFSVGEQTIRYFSEKDPAQLPWKRLDIDIVFECTGLFTRREDLDKHLQAGAKFAILSAPTKSEDVPSVVYGVNQPDGQVQAISCASCTTNAIAPVVEVMGRRIGIKKAIMTTVHGYTASQELVDGPHKKWRRGRAAAANLVPTSTGAAIATTKALPEYEGKFDGVAIRAPVPSGSIADLVFVTERATSVEEVNQIFREEAQTERYEGALGVTDEEYVSSDILRDPRGSVVDLGMTMVVDGDLVKIMAWYDNEWGYANQMVREAVRISDTLKTRQQA